MSLATRIAARDPIYGRIWRALPRGVDVVLREDIASDVYLAIREGRLHPRDVEANARRFVNAAIAAFASKWGALSLDVMISDYGGMTFVETIEDPQALAAFDAIEFREGAA